MEVYVIRHTTPNIGKDICYGQLDVGLSESFLQEAEQISEKIPMDMEAIYSSPLRRCFDLAHFINERNQEFGTEILRPIQKDTRLMEMDFGFWEGKKWSDIDEKDLNVWMTDFVNILPEGGENLSLLYKRVSTFLDELRLKNHHKVLIVTHAGVYRCLWAYLLEIPLKNVFKISVGYGDIFKFKLGMTKEMDSFQG